MRRWAAMLAMCAIAALPAPGAPAQDAAVQPSRTRVAVPAPAAQDTAAPAPRPRAAAPAPVRKPPAARPATINSPIGITVQVIPTAPTVYVTSLGPPMPNPVTWSTVIHYSLAKPSYVSIRVYSITGQEAAKLVEWHNNAGIYSVRWDGTGPRGRLSPGVYLIRMVAGSYSRSQRVVLVR